MTPKLFIPFVMLWALLIVQGALAEAVPVRLARLRPWKPV